MKELKNMKRTFIETIQYGTRLMSYYIRHPKFAYKYAKRFDNSFNQSDLECCVSNIYEFRIGKKLDLNNVKTFNEKLNWLKCFYHDDRMTECANKVTAPKYFMSRTGLDDRYIVKNIGNYDEIGQIDFSKLPKSFVLKSNWGSAKQIIIKDRVYCF